jgi:hypothetical protein
MKNEKETKNDQKLIEKAKEAGRIREEQIQKVYIETMRNKKAKE